MKLAFVFPGQGSHSIGMMAGFDGHSAVAELTSLALTDGAAIDATRAALAA
jgi:hypothetical protein